ncbi:ferritin-like domain-containing protein [Pseudofrankia saprophytica]|uniref:ferritin-like domain-containing protein n=1 Tax=Pseudofrankia saprophytica TaxID=298655 RepID=UPI00056C2741|nr:ferritin-like domain-containing protein [Pseudofrankia saprophytica]OHV35700.1 hypothetical protein BCD49_21955 [Pseudofrankia sp. EUN1h]
MPEDASEAFDSWRHRFEANRFRPDPDWRAGAEIPRALAISLARIQVGEASDGAGMMRAAARAGHPGYLEATRLFIAEEQDHSRLLARLLIAAGRPTIAAHWSDTIFRSLRWRARLPREVLVLTVAEVCVLRYFQMVRDGAGDQLTREVAARILTDEQEHVPFHVRRLRLDLAGLPGPTRALIAAAWWALLAVSAAVLAINHRAALRLFGVFPNRYFADTLRLFAPVAKAALAAGPADQAETPTG